MSKGIGKGYSKVKEENNSDLQVHLLRKLTTVDTLNFVDECYAPEDSETMKLQTLTCSHAGGSWLYSIVLHCSEG
jgi:hypothetical protein